MEVRSGEIAPCPGEFMQCLVITTVIQNCGVNKFSAALPRYIGVIRDFPKSAVVGLTGLIHRHAVQEVLSITMTHQPAHLMV